MSLHTDLLKLANFNASMKGFYLDEDELRSNSFDKKIIYENVGTLAQILSWVNSMGSF